MAGLPADAVAAARPSPGTQRTLFASCCSQPAPAASGTPSSRRSTERPLPDTVSELASPAAASKAMTLKTVVSFGPRLSSRVTLAVAPRAPEGAASSVTAQLRISARHTTSPTTAAAGR